MKDIKPKVDPQIDMVEDRFGIMRQRITNKIVNVCDYHTYATEHDIIPIYNARKDEVIKRCRYCEEQKAKNKLKQKKRMVSAKRKCYGLLCSPDFGYWL